MSTPRESSRTRVERLQEFLNDNGFRTAKRFRGRGKAEDEEVEMFLDPESGRMVIVHLFDGAATRGFELYVSATTSNKIEETFAATLTHLTNL
jgi:hypothetical protein